MLVCLNAKNVTLRFLLPGSEQSQGFDSALPVRTTAINSKKRSLGLIDLPVKTANYASKHIPNAKTVSDMSSIIIDSWWATAAANETFLVIPDGCRDLILKILPGQKPHWFISPLQSRTNFLCSQAGVYSEGYRLQPGTVIDEHALTCALNHQQHNEADVAALIAQYCHRPPAVSEILQALACETGSVAKAAAQLGVQTRTLQRQLLKLTGTSPNFWLMLARARKAARMLTQPLTLSEIAYLQGFPDQPHMCREFVRWFNISPAKLNPETAQFVQLQHSGYS